MSARAWKRRRNKAVWRWLDEVVTKVAAETGGRYRATAMGMTVTRGEWRGLPEYFWSLQMPIPASPSPPEPPAAASGSGSR